MPSSACGTTQSARSGRVEARRWRRSSTRPWWASPNRTRATFELALEAVAVPAASAIHVGDTPGADVDGARAAGVRPVLVDPYDFHSDLDVERVTSLLDVVELVRTRQPA